MTSSLTLTEVLSKAPNIRVFYGGISTVLKARAKGANQITTPLSEHSIIGNGTKEEPFTHAISMDVNPHNIIVDLWLKSLSHHPSDTNPIFLQVNDWILQVRSDGVISEDDHFTRLLPV